MLDKKGLAYNTVNLHRSAISGTLPPVDGVPVGAHPLVKRLLKGVFHRRPPRRRLFPSWDAGAIFAVFNSWTRPLAPFQLLRKCAFLLAMASARRPSELASFKFSSNFMILSGDSVRFLPSKLSKTDRVGHLGPAIRIARLPFKEHCPVNALEDYLLFRSSLALRHDYLFVKLSFPYAPLSTSSFSSHISALFRSAGIHAPPGSTRAMSVSHAFASGSSLDSILRAGDWSGAQTCSDLP